MVNLVRTGGNGGSGILICAVESSNCKKFGKTHVTERYVQRSRHSISARIARLLLYVIQFGLRRRRMESLPRIYPPSVTTIQTPSLPLPTADVPSYQPLVVPPQDLRRPEGTKEVQTEETLPKIHFPPLPSITLPSQEVLVAASVTAVTAVAAATATQPVINALKDRIQKFLQGKINKWKQNRQKRKASSKK